MNSAFASLGKNLILLAVVALSVINFFYSWFGFKELLGIQLISGLAYVFLSCYEVLNASFKASLPVLRFSYFTNSFVMFRILKIGVFFTFAVMLFSSHTRIQYLYPICVIIALTEGIIIYLKYKKQLCFVSIYANYILFVQTGLVKVFASQVALVEFRHDIFYFVTKGDFYLKNETIEKYYGSYPYFNKKEDNLFLRLHWIDNQLDFGNLYYKEILLDNVKKYDFSKSTGIHIFTHNQIVDFMLEKLLGKTVSGPKSNMIGTLEFKGYTPLYVSSKTQDTQFNTRTSSIQFSGCGTSEFIVILEKNKDTISNTLDILETISNKQFNFNIDDVSNFEIENIDKYIEVNKVAESLYYYKNNNKTQQIKDFIKTNILKIINILYSEEITVNQEEWYIKHLDNKYNKNIYEITKIFINSIQQKIINSHTGGFGDFGNIEHTAYTSHRLSSCVYNEKEDN